MYPEKTATTQCFFRVLWSPGSSAVPFYTKHCHSPLSSLLALHFLILHFEMIRAMHIKASKHLWFPLVNESSLDVAPATVEHDKGFFQWWAGSTLQLADYRHCSFHHLAKRSSIPGYYLRRKNINPTTVLVLTRGATKHEEQWKSKLQGFWWNDSFSIEQSVVDENQPS